MRVCLLTLDFPPFRSSGLTLYAERIARGLATRGHAVTVVASNRADEDRVEEASLPTAVRIVRVPASRFDWIGFGWQAARYLRSRADDFDILHFADVHFAYAHRGPFIVSAFQSFRQRLTSDRGQPYHTDWRNRLFRLIYYTGARWLMEGPALRRTRHVIMSSAATQREFIEHYDVGRSRTTLVYPGIDVHRFEALPTQDEARRRLALPFEGPVVLYVGFSTPRKGVEYLAEALAMMQTPAHLVMVGKWEPRYQERFLSALGDMRSRAHVAGYVADADLPTYYAAADVFALPTLLEGFGYPLVEAMAAGVPIVTTTGGSADEIVGNAGLVVPVGDSTALASAVDRLLTDADLVQDLSQTGRKRVRSLFDADRAAAEIEAIYRRVLAQCE